MDYLGQEEGPAVRTATTTYTIAKPPSNAPLVVHAWEQIESGKWSLADALLNAYKNLGYMSTEEKAAYRNLFDMYTKGKSPDKLFPELFPIDKFPDPGMYVGTTYHLLPKLYEWAMGTHAARDLNGFLKQYSDYLISIQDDKPRFDASKNHLRIILDKHFPTWMDSASYDNLFNFGGQVYPDKAHQIWEKASALDLDRFIKTIANAEKAIPASQRNTEPMRKWMEENLPENFLDMVSQESQNLFLEVYAPEILDQAASDLAIDSAGAGAGGGGKLLGFAVVGLIGVVALGALAGGKGKRRG